MATPGIFSAGEGSEKGSLMAWECSTEWLWAPMPALMDSALIPKWIAHILDAPLWLGDCTGVRSTDQVYKESPGMIISISCCLHPQHDGSCRSLATVGAVSRDSLKHFRGNLGVLDPTVLEQYHYHTLRSWHWTTSLDSQIITLNTLFFHIPKTRLAFHLWLSIFCWQVSNCILKF